MAKTKRLRTRRSRVTLAVVCVVVLAVAAFFIYRAMTGEAEAAVTYSTGTAQKMTLTSSISGTGNVTLSDTASVKPAVSGEVSGLGLGIGDKVQKGQTLFVLVNPELDVAVDGAQNAYDKAVLGVQQAKLAVLQAKKDLSDLYKRSYTSLQIKQAKAAITSAQLSVTTAENTVRSAELTLQEAKDDAAARTVTAPMSGTVTELSVENGDEITGSSGASAAVMTITDPERFEASVTLAESDIGSVEEGQKVVLTFDALPDLTLSGKVTRVDTTGANNSGVVSYTVIVTPDIMDPSVRGGMTVSANIITDVAADVLAVPSTAVKSATDGTKYVQVLQNGQPANVMVETGMSNDSYTEITSGLTEGQEIITATSTAGKSTTATTNRNSGNAFGEGGFVIQGGGPGGAFGPPGQ
jgi:RND family efflux transporter MFP subunit